METIDMERSRLEYREHEWAVHHVGLSEGPSATPAGPWEPCNSDSTGARERWGASPYRFYADLELLAADLDPLSGSQFGVLTEEWRGHQPGALVMTVYVRDTSAEWGFVTVACIADDPFPQQRVA